jgi:hypothetical protein
VVVVAQQRNWSAVASSSAAPNKALQRNVNSLALVNVR